MAVEKSKIVQGFEVIIIIEYNKGNIERKEEIV